MRIINLKKEKSYLDQYVKLRNKNRMRLLSGAVNRADSEIWLQEKRIVALGVVKGRLLEGAVILYEQKKGEIAFFVRTPGKGIGTILLKNILKAAKKKKASYVWAWVLKSNKIAQHLFIKEGFLSLKETVRMFAGRERKGIFLKKSLRGRVR